MIKLGAALMLNAISRRKRREKEKQIKLVLLSKLMRTCVRSEENVQIMKTRKGIKKVIGSIARIIQSRISMFASAVLSREAKKRPKKNRPSSSALHIIDSNIIKNQAIVIKVMEKEVTEKEAEIDKDRKQIALMKIVKRKIWYNTLLLGAFHRWASFLSSALKVPDWAGYRAQISELAHKKRQLKLTLNAASESLESSYKKNLQINIDQNEESKEKKALPPIASQPTDVTSTNSQPQVISPLLMAAKRDNPAIAEAGEWMEFSNTGDNNSGINPESSNDQEDKPVDSMQYLMAAEERNAELNNQIAQLEKEYNDQANYFQKQKAELQKQIEKLKTGKM